MEGVGIAGKVARVNHGYARNFLVPNKLAMVVPRPRRGKVAAEAEGGAAQQAGSAAARSNPAEVSLEKQQQQFDKLMKTLTGSTLVRGGRLRHGYRCLAAVERCWQRRWYRHAAMTQWNRYHPACMSPGLSMSIIGSARGAFCAAVNMLLLKPLLACLPCRHSSGGPKMGKR